jgi:hypothetical protein
MEWIVALGEVRDEDCENDNDSYMSADGDDGESGLEEGMSEFGY